MLILSAVSGGLNNLDISEALATPKFSKLAGLASSARYRPVISNFSPSFSPFNNACLLASHPSPVEASALFQLNKSGLATFLVVETFFEASSSFLSLTIALELSSPQLNYVSKQGLIKMPSTSHKMIANIESVNLISYGVGLIKK